MTVNSSGNSTVAWSSEIVVVVVGRLLPVNSASRSRFSVEEALNAPIQLFFIFLIVVVLLRPILLVFSILPFPLVVLDRLPCDIARSRSSFGASTSWTDRSGMLLYGLGVLACVSEGFPVHCLNWFCLHAGRRIFVVDNPPNFRALRLGRCSCIDRGIYSRHTCRYSSRLDSHLFCLHRCVLVPALDKPLHGPHTN
ncbi:hypothetical protein EV714DRAFT_247781 [Schizophyllum commune]